MRYRDNQVCRGVVALDVTKDAALVAAVRDFRDRVAEFEVEIDALSAKVSHQRRLQFNLKRRCSLQDGNEFQGAVWSIQHLRLRYAKECRRASSGDRAYATVFDVLHKNFLRAVAAFRPRPLETQGACIDVVERARGTIASVKAAQCPIGHARGWMARSSQAPVLVLAAPDALAPVVPMAIRTAAAQRERRRNRR